MQTVKGDQTVTRNACYRKHIGELEAKVRQAKIESDDAIKVKQTAAQPHPMHTNVVADYQYSSGYRANSLRRLILYGYKSSKHASIMRTEYGTPQPRSVFSSRLYSLHKQPQLAIDISL